MKIFFFFIKVIWEVKLELEIYLLSKILILKEIDNFFRMYYKLDIF